ncbi:Rap guanine nucleotide exchange factor 1 [Frankliniella fusca]|uniref:Rap guanine nucleotide exchange factor 1 n=1 Tax=Frankliniella fusca TaxID=407009 RepID=A0AAE1L817_9NEOP|nr:Rap guanine nucleotide exchange factor 1 [Frankliniella fusca]
MDLDTLQQQDPEARRIINSITSVPSPENPCIVFWVSGNISFNNTRLFAQRLVELAGHFQTAYLDKEARAAKRESARAQLNAKLQIPPLWQISQVLIIEKPTQEYSTGLSLAKVYQLIKHLESSKLSKSKIVDCLAELVSIAFTPSSPAEPSAPSAPPSVAADPIFVDLVSPVSGDKKSQLPPQVQDLHKEIEKTLKPPPTSPPAVKPRVLPPTSPPKVRTDTPPRRPKMAELLSLLSTNIPRFSGNKDEDVDAYIRRLENTFALFEMPPEAQRSVLLATTDGIANFTATRFIDSNRSCTAADLKEALRKAFKPTTGKRATLQRLSGRLLKPDEHLRGYVQDVLKLCALYDGAMSEKRKVEFVLQGLPPDLQTALLPDDPKTVDELVERVEKVTLAKTRIRQAEALHHINLAGSSSLVANVSTPAPQPAAEMTHSSQKKSTPSPAPSPASPRRRRMQRCQT